MYEELFQTPDRPFRATPDVRFYCPYDSMEQTRQTVLRVIRRAEGPAAVMGSVGLGKSLLAHLLADDLADRFDVVRLHAARLCSRRALLQSVLFELQLAYRDLSEGELRLSLMERMEPSPEHAADGLVLIIDEAQTLPTKLLEELRLITNFARHGQARARLVLLGTMQLEETLALPELNSFNQRLAARCFLQPMNRQQTADFVRHQFCCVDVDPKQIITRDALENVYVACEGIPRIANQVMDHALILAIANDQYPISAALIQEAWADLQQLPMSWNQADESYATPVEFGSIEDLDQDFELEPEGVEELEFKNSSRHWPAPTDLEDFGPHSTQSNSHVGLHTAAPQLDNVTPRNPVAGRVVFDAKAAFAARSESLKMPVATASSKTNTQLFDREISDHDLFIFQDEDPPTPGFLEPAYAQPSDHTEETSFDNASQASEQNTSRPSTVPISALRHNKFAAWSRADDALEFDDAPSAVASARSTHRSKIDFSQVDLKQVDHNYADHNEPVHTIEFEIDLATLAIPMPLASVHQPQAHDPFGEDFDEEFPVDAGDVRRWQERQQSRRQYEESYEAPTQSGLRSHAGRENQFEQTAKSTANGQVEPLLVFSTALDNAALDSSLSQVQQFVTEPPLEGNFASDLVGMVGSTDNQLQDEIEDLISQLNFSAFSVEMDSVEDISSDFARQSASAPKFDDAHQPHNRNLKYAAYPIRPEEQIDSIAVSALDDDRDLLIIEEEIPASMRNHKASVAAPSVSAVSYPQLFQQLRM